MRVCIKRQDKSILAYGDYNPETKMLIVKKGSKVSSTIGASPSFRSAKAIICFRDKFVKDFIVMEDVIFKSCSTAANFVTGNSSNGYVVWRTEDGVLLQNALSRTVNKKEHSGKKKIKEKRADDIVNSQK